MARSKFSDAEDEVLIELIRAHPELYDHENKHYKNLRVKDNNWAEISSILGKDVNICKKRWKDIKDNFIKIKRRYKMGKDSTSPPKTLKWALFPHLIFLDNVSRKKKISNNSKSVKIEDNVIEQEVNSDSTSADPLETNPLILNVRSRGRKRKELEIKQQSIQKTPKLLEKQPKLLEKQPKLLEKQDDDVDMFLKSIAITMKQLPPNLIAEAKMSILSTVSKLQFSSPSTTFNYVENSYSNSSDDKS